MAYEMRKIANIMSAEDGREFLHEFVDAVFETRPPDFDDRSMAEWLAVMRWHMGRMLYRHRRCLECGGEHDGRCEMSFSAKYEANA